MEYLAALENAYAEGADTVGAVGRADLDRPTPCREWDVRALVDHMINALDVFPAMLRGEPPEMGETFTDGDLVAAYRRAADENLAAWAEPGALETPAPMLGDVPMVELNLADAVVHTWDLATALGRPFSPDVALVDVAYDAVCQWPLDVSREAGAFGPAVTVPDDAPILDRLVGLLGREP